MIARVIRRYARIYAYFVRFSFSRAMEFRLDFFFTIVMDALFYAINIAFYKTIFALTPTLAGWKEHEAILFTCGYFVVDAIAMTVLSSNLWWLPVLINKGDLDYYLVRPVNSLFFVSLRNFAANSFMNLVIALGLTGWMIATFPEPLGAGRVLLFGAALMVGTFLYYLTQIVFLIPVFWTQSGRGFSNLSHSLIKVIERPDRIYTGWVRRVLTTILPLCLIASFPARLAFEQFDWRVLAQMLGVATLLAIAVFSFWRAGLRVYGSASS